MSAENIEVEQDLLGALLVDNSLLAMMPALEASHFSEPVHQRIFLAIEETTSAGHIATPQTLKTRFEGDPALADIGGGQYLAKIAANALSVISPLEYAACITSLAQRRAFRDALKESLQALDDSGSEETPTDLSLSLIARFENISRGFDGPKFETDLEVSDRILKSLATAYQPISVGMPRLDFTMGGGLYPGKSYGFAAKKKHGKTILAGTISENLNQQGVKHLFICGEMGPDEIHQRTLCRLTQSFPSAFRNDYGQSPNFQRKVGDAAARSKGCILYHNAPGLTFERLRRVVLAAILQHKVSGFILDYWQLVGGKNKQQSTSEHLDTVAQWIADICRKYGVWSITMAQINQEGNTRGGEGMRLAFDQVYQIHRPDLGKPGTWLEMMDTRYTAWNNIGNDNEPGYLLMEQGPYFEEQPKK